MPPRECKVLRCQGAAAQSQAALEIWFEPNWPALVELSTQAAPAYAALVADARQRMRRALVVARKARGG